MLFQLKEFLKNAFHPLLYGLVYFIVPIIAIFKDAFWGVFTLVSLSPQPNIWYSFHGYPFGKDCMDILVFATVVGILIQGRWHVKSDNAIFIWLFALGSYLSLWNTSVSFSLPMPITTENVLLATWKNYFEMILLYFLAFYAVRNEKHQKIIVVLIALVVLFISIRSFRNFTAGDVFSYDKRVGGPFEAVGLGSNHLGAFIAYTWSLLLGLFLFDSDRRRKMLYLVTVLFGLHPLFFSYSRGAYFAVLAVLFIYGILKKRSLLILCTVLFLTWQFILPASVVDRISMTQSTGGEIEESAALRLDLWDHALNLFKQNPVFGIGFGGFGFTVPPGTLTDTHNFYVKTLSEQGVIGIALLLIILAAALRSGWRFYRTAQNPFHKGLGFGFIGYVLACMMANVFGDRWSYFSLGAYFWILWGLVDRGLANRKTEQLAQAVETPAVSNKPA
jgi:putative inorganic carbon (HCO3(-)) transporter